MYYPEHLKVLGKSTPQNTFFAEQLPVADFKCQLFFLKRGKQKQFFIPPLSLIRSKSCNCIKIKILFIHNSEKILQSIVQFFYYKGRKTALSLLFTLTFTFSFKFLQTSLIIKNLIKHENKFNRKVFHNRENSEKRFSEFLYFMKGFKKKSYTFLGSLHNETNVKYAFHEMFWKKYFTVYPRLKEHYWAVAVTRVSLVLHSCRTRVASIALVLLVLYPCRSCLALVL